MLTFFSLFAVTGQNANEGQLCCTVLGSTALIGPCEGTTAHQLHRPGKISLCNQRSIKSDSNASEHVMMETQRSWHSDPKIYISQHAKVIELNQHPKLSKKPQGPASLNEKLHPFEASTNAAEISCRCFSILAIVKWCPRGNAMAQQVKWSEYILIWEVASSVCNYMQLRFCFSKGGYSNAASSSLVQFIGISSACSHASRIQGHQD